MTAITLFETVLIFLIVHAKFQFMVIVKLLLLHCTHIYRHILPDLACIRFKKTKKRENTYLLSGVQLLKAAETTLRKGLLLAHRTTPLAGPLGSGTLKRSQ